MQQTNWDFELIGGLWPLHYKILNPTLIFSIYLLRAKEGGIDFKMGLRI